MKRRRVAQGMTAGAVAALALPGLVRAQGARVPRFVPFADLSLLDPVATTATPARNHAFLVFDALYGIATEFRAQPQMVQGHPRGGGRAALDADLARGPALPRWDDRAREGLHRLHPSLGRAGP